MCEAAGTSEASPVEASEYSVARSIRPKEPKGEGRGEIENMTNYSSCFVLIEQMRNVVKY